MANGLQDDEDQITGINVTPLVDVMLVLLIIFMMTASYIVHQSILVDLPKAETSEAIVKTKNLAFVLDKESKLFVDGQTLQFEEIPERIAKERAQRPDSKDLQALISADKETPHGQVIRLIDVIRKSGISEFAINVEAVQK